MPHGKHHDHHHDEEKQHLLSAGGATYPNDEGLTSGEHWWEEGLWQTPKVLKHWGDEEEERKISWTELFMDLIYVTVIAKLGDNLREQSVEEDEAGEGSFFALINYILYFYAMVSLWGATTLYATRFHTDDLFHKLYHAVLMLCIYSMGVHAKGGIDGPNAGGYALAASMCRCLHILAYVRIYWCVPKARVACLGCFFAYAVSVTFWLLSVFVEEHRVYYFFLGTITEPLIIFVIFGFLVKRQTSLPLHTGHFVERMGLFVIIVLGECVNGITIDPSVDNTYRLYMAGILGFCSVVMLKLLYFDVDSQEMSNHALNNTKPKSFTWSYGHNILIIVIALTGSGLAMICEGENKKGHKVSPRGIHYLNGGFAITYLLLAAIRWSHKRPLLPHIEELSEEQSKHANFVLTKMYYTQQIAQIVVAFLNPVWGWLCTHEYISDLTLLAVLAVVSCALVTLNLFDEIFLSYYVKKELEKNEHHK